MMNHMFRFLSRDCNCSWLLSGPSVERYDARVSLVPEDGVWKIREIEVLDEERVR